jgi:plastocyanin
MSETLRIACGVAAVAALAACGSGAEAGGAAATQPPGSAPGYRVSVPDQPDATVRQTDQLLFEPTWISVRSGHVVEWINDSSVVHNVTFNDPALVSPTMNSQNRYAVLFQRPGTYTYRCTFHVPSMTATVVVTP